MKLCLINNHSAHVQVLACWNNSCVKARFLFLFVKYKYDCDSNWVATVPTKRTKTTDYYTTAVSLHSKYADLVVAGFVQDLELLWSECRVLTMRQ